MKHATKKNTNEDRKKKLEAALERLKIKEQIDALKAKLKK